MNKTITLGLCMVFLLVSLVSAEEYIVYINGIAFPEPFDIVSGDTVTWVNNHSITHTITDSYGYWFDSGDVAPGENWSHTFYTLGNNPYYCIYAPGMMESSIFVTTPEYTGSAITPEIFNTYNSTQLANLMVESYVGVEMEWENLMVYFEYTTLEANWLTTENNYGTPELEFVPTNVIVQTDINYEVLQHCYDAADALGQNGGSYCTNELIKSLTPYDFNGIDIPTVSLQLQEQYQQLYNELESLQEFSIDYVDSQSQNLMDIQLAIIGWFT